MKICVQGLWHLGLVTASALASVGHDIIGLDFDKSLIESLKQGKTPIYEPGLDELMNAGLSSGKLQFIEQPDELPKDLDVLWITYDTPVNELDEADINYVIDQIIAVLPLLPVDTLVILSSQMPVGSIKHLEKTAHNLNSGKQLRFACLPENLRLGKGLEIFLKPDRVIAGIRTKKDQRQITQLLQPITDKIEWMSVESAEMTKHAINAFLATSVVFTNEVASICEMVGADAKEVERGLKSEQRIGPKAYLSPGSAFSGGTLARDIEFLKEVSQSHQLSIPLLKSVKNSNDQHKFWVRRKLRYLFPNLIGQTILVWGLTYKPGTDTLRRSLSVELCQWLLAQGASVKIHDPAVKALPQEWDNLIEKLAHPLDKLEQFKVLVVGTEWPDYKNISVEQVTSKNPNLIVLDPNRFLSSWNTMKNSEVEGAKDCINTRSELQQSCNKTSGLRYFAVGTPNGVKT